VFQSKIYHLVLTNCENKSLRELPLFNLQIFLFRIWFQKYTKQCRSVQTSDNVFSDIIFQSSSRHLKIEMAFPNYLKSSSQPSSGYVLSSANQTRSYHVTALLPIRITVTKLICNNIQLMTFHEVNTRFDQPIEHDIHRVIRGDRYAYCSQ
jgi:hypothetical protein